MDVVGGRQLLAMRMVSISIKNLDVLLKTLAIEMRNENFPEPLGGYRSEQLKDYFIKKKIYPPEKYLDQQYFSPDKPDLTVTYMWPTIPIEKIAEILKRRFDENLKTYLDILLNDQRSKGAIKIALYNAYLR